MKTAIITGVTGQDGSYLSELLLEKGYDVHGVIRRSSLPNTSRIDHIFDPEVTGKLHYGDLTEGIDHLLYILQPDVVFDLGAMSHVKISFDVPVSTMEMNAIGPLKILEGIRKVGLTKKTRYYRASSSEMFGLTPPPQNENTIMKPSSPYGCAKLAAYHLTRIYRDGYGMFASNGILFNHESPRRGVNFVTKKITRIACRIKLGLEKEIHLGNLEALRDWGHSRDYCFVSGTKILVKSTEGSYHTISSKNIEEIKEGDELLSYNEASGKKEFDFVVGISQRMSNNCVKVRFSNHNYLIATDNHPIATINNGQIEWKNIRDLNSGDKVIQKKHFSITQRVRNIYRNSKPIEDVYGQEKAQEIRNKIGNYRRGKDYKELYGIERSKEIIEKRSETYHNNYIKDELNYTKRSERTRGVCNGNYKEGKTLTPLYCIDCGRVINHLVVHYNHGNQRCRSCASLHMWQDENYRKKIYKELVERWKDTRYVEKRSTAYKVLWLDENFRKQMVESQKRGWENEDRRIEFSKIMKQKWKDPEFRDKTLYNMFKAVRLGPNNVERQLMDILQQVCPGQFDYVGNGKTIIEGKNPDFIHVTKNKIIELYGDYWHRNDNPQDRIDLFSKSNYDTLIIWESELKSKDLRERIETFLFNPDIEIVEVVDVERQTLSQMVYNIQTEKNHNYFAHGILVHNCDAIIKIMEHHTPDDFVISTGEAHSVREFAEKVFTYLELNFYDYLVQDSAYERPIEVPALLGDSTKARNVLGWEPEVTFDELVREMVDYDMWVELNNKY